MEDTEARQRKCERCNRRVNLVNYELHLTRCKPKQPKPSKKEAREAKKREEEAARAARETQPKEEPEEKIPCYNCGYQQTLAELDTHPVRCPHREVPCTHCSMKYPISILDNHKEVCLRRPQRVMHPRPQPATSNNNVFRDLSQPRPEPPLNFSSRPISNNTSQLFNILRAGQNHSSVPVRNTSVSSVPARSQEVVAPQAENNSRPVNNSQNVHNGPSRSQNGFYIPPAQNRDRNIFMSQSSQPNIFASRNRSSEEESSNASQRPQPRQDAERPPRMRIEESSGQALYRRVMERGMQYPVDHEELIEIQARRQRMMEDVVRMAARTHAQLVQQIAARNATNSAQGLSKSSIKSIPERKYKPREEKDDCSICCTELQEDDNVKDFKCKHEFHAKCISDWLSINNTCPLCKCDLSVNVPEEQREKMEKKSKPKQVVRAPQRHTSVMGVHAYMASGWDDSEDE